MRRFGWLIFAWATAACGEPPADRIETIVKFKILAVRAEKPDLRPGDTTRVEVLVGAPSPTSMTTFIVPFSQAAAADYGAGRADFTGAGTAFNYAPGTTNAIPPIDLGVPLPAKAAPNFGSAYYAAPPTPGAYTLGVFAREGVPAVNLGASRDALQAQLREEMAAAFKAFKTVRVVAEGEPLNTNPVVTGLEPVKRWRENKDGRLTGPLDVEGFTLAPEQILRIKVNFTDEDPDRASAVWWITDGAIDGYDRQDMDYVAPKKAGLQTIIALLLDRQGGNTWYFQDVAVGVDDLTPEPPVAGAAKTLLAQSGGRMLWLGFAEAASAATVTKALAKKPVVLEGVPTPSAEARLGWYFDAPRFVGYADEVTGAGVANDIYGVPRGKEPVRLVFQRLIR